MHQQFELDNKNTKKLLGLEFRKGYFGAIFWWRVARDLELMKMWQRSPEKKQARALGLIRTGLTKT